MKSIDRKQTTIYLICVENNNRNNDVKNYLEAHQYVKFISLGQQDDVYYKKGAFTKIGMKTDKWGINNPVLRRLYI